MPLLSFFPTGIYKEKIILDKKYKKQLVDSILNQEKTKPNKSKNKAWLGDEYGDEYLHNNKLFNILYENISKLIKSYLDTMGYNEKSLNIYFQRSWATISRNSQNISMHTHMQSHLSYAYYLLLPEGSGKLEFSNERSYNEIISGSHIKAKLLEKITNKLTHHNSPNIVCSIEEDEIYIFPSKLKHGTHPGTNSDPRISLSSDIILALNENINNTEMGIPDITFWKKY